MHLAPVLKYPGVDPVLRPIHLWMAVGSGALTALCVATWTVISFATEKNIRNKSLTRRLGPPPWLSSAPHLLVTLGDNKNAQGSLSQRTMRPAIKFVRSQQIGIWQWNRLEK